MALRTNVSWADATWPVTVGCDKVSAGCYGCYAMRDAKRMGSNPNTKISEVYHGLVERQANGLLNWTGVVRELPERLDWPAKWRNHRDIFVCSQSDLFHEGISAEFIGQVFNTMWNNPQHTYYVLTKRPERLLTLLEASPPAGLADLNNAHFPHVIIGISAEDQAAAEKRLPLLARLPLPSHQLFVSAEPLISRLDLSQWLDRIGWVIVGGESGRHARPMHPNWARLLRDQCEGTGILYHFKQWGEWVTKPPRVGMATLEEGVWRYHLQSGRTPKPVPTLIQNGTTFYRVGRHSAGRILDGVYWNARPGRDDSLMLAPHALGTSVTVCDHPQFADMSGIVTAIQSLEPDGSLTNGEDVTYWITPEGKPEIPQAFSYWQLQPQPPEAGSVEQYA